MSRLQPKWVRCACGALERPYLACLNCSQREGVPNCENCGRPSTWARATSCHRCAPDEWAQRVGQIDAELEGRGASQRNDGPERKEAAPAHTPTKVVQKNLNFSWKAKPKKFVTVSTTDGKKTKTVVFDLS